MMSLIVRFLDWLARLFYFAGHNRRFRMSVLALCALSTAGIIWSHSAKNEDTRIYPTTVNAIRATLAERYVQISGQLQPEGALEVPATFAGVLPRVMRFVPLSQSGGREPLFVLDEGLPAGVAEVMLTGKVLMGDDPQPPYYLRVMDPPNPLLFDAANGAGLVTLALVATSMVVGWVVRRADYAISIPLGLADSFATSAATAPQLLWFGSLGAGYGDVVLRQVPVSFKAIPAEAKFIPVGYPDQWSVTIRRPRLVQYQTVATSFGALPAIRLEFEDERGIARDGVVAVSKPAMRDSILEVLRFVGR